MLFSCGLGIGFVFYSVTEPLTHLHQSSHVIDMGMAGKAGGVPKAIEMTLLDWGIHGWALFALAAWAIAFPAYRLGKPLTVATGLYGILGDRCNTSIWGRVADGLGTLGTIGGNAAMIGLGVASSRGKKGLFETADQGTLFLDEIGEISLPIQVKLLKFLETMELFWVGGTTPIKINTKIIVATNQDLEEMVEKGRFRRDLYFRLNVVPIRIPSLVERSEDIVPLALSFLDRFNQEFNTRKTLSLPFHPLSVYQWCRPIIPY